MRRTDWLTTVIVISVGMLILVVSFILTTTGNEEILLGIMSVMTPLVALVLGAVGLKCYGRDSGTKDDRFNTFNYWFAIGLIMLSLAEIAGTLVSLSSDFQQTILIIALVQLPGLLLWGIGILQYLRSLNEALGYIKPNNLWIVLFLTTTLSTISIIVIIATQFPTIGFIESIVLSPIIVGLALFVIITTILVVIFRKGFLAKPLFLILGALLLYLVRCLLWLISDVGFVVSIDRVIATEAFILCGAALLMARNLGSMDT
ncbi:MAG: hypothetical protein E4H14_15085 [Candidatus Thorarchaeota archaeon]|nr:MAG: hypothetical protein E4H14_15085 [Candidatus Thorarchaeota archaeon]